MEIINPPEFCEECKKEKLEGFVYYCYTCSKWLCYDCLNFHNSDNEQLIFFKVTDHIAEIVNHGKTMYGIPKQKWPVIPLNRLDQKNKCPHSINFQENDFIFICWDCNTILCKDCIQNHQEHRLMLHLNRGENGFRQIDHSRNKTNLTMCINLKYPKEAFELEYVDLDITIWNNSRENLYDINIVEENAFGTDSISKDINHHIRKLKPNQESKFLDRIQMPKRNTKEDIKLKIILNYKDNFQAFNVIVKDITIKYNK